MYSKEPEVQQQASTSADASSSWSAGALSVSRVWEKHFPSNCEVSNISGQLGQEHIGPLGLFWEVIFFFYYYFFLPPPICQGHPLCHWKVAMNHDVVVGKRKEEQLANSGEMLSLFKELSVSCSPQRKYKDNQAELCLLNRSPDSFTAG